MAIPEKYGHISFVPPAGVRREAAKGLAMRREHGRGGTAIGIARARDLSNGKELSPSTVRRMKAFFDRHAPDRKAKGFRPGEPGFPSNGRIADLLWGGRSGEAFANKVVKQMNAADERTEGRSIAMMPNVERRYLGHFGAEDATDHDLLKVEHRADPQTGKKQTYIVGYAAKFNTNSLLLGDFIERIDPGAFEIVTRGKDFDGKPLATRCLFNHDPNHLLGRFPTTMKMTVDKVGLRYECLLPESRKDIAESVARGDLKGSSFSFVVAEGGEKWSSENGQSIRTVTKVKALLDCSPVTYPAYDDATVAIARRSYAAYASTSSVPKVNAAAEIEKTRKFISERRDCGRDESGKFSSGNTCAGASNSEDSAWREGGKVGAVIGAAAGTIGGAPGVIAGAAIGAVTGAMAGLFGKQSQEGLEKAYKATGTSLAKADKAAKTLDKKMVVSAGEGDSLVMKGDGVTVEVHPGEKETGVPKYMVVKGAGNAIGGKGAESAGRLAASVTKAAKQLGVEMVIVHADPDDASHVGGFQDAGFSYSLNDGGESVTLTKRIPKSTSRRSYDELMAFFESRAADCGRDDDGKFGSGNTCAVGATPGDGTGVGLTAAAGMALGSGIGAAAGLPGILAGAAIGGAFGAVVGHFGGEAHRQKYEEAKKSLGVTESGVNAAAAAMPRNGDRLPTVLMMDSNSIAIMGPKDDVALISRGDQVNKDDKSKNSLHYIPTQNDNPGETALSLAKKAGVKSVTSEAKDEKQAKSLEKAGFKQIKPGGLLSNSVYWRKVGEPKSRRSYEELMAFFESRAGVATKPAAITVDANALADKVASDTLQFLKGRHT